ncbi:glucose 1-dehydrogenase [Streptomyces sp. NBC_01298]|uniref:SDR family NAD(P)-dependent oxidoreductase n=1 Tax=Streptomyces sp. NBC_01298 TaxID=2903817 RepID=UPI002E134C7C|nr:glucose 1-dehydrogenase [Streptomyces sp. NBC_01298]
MSARFTGKSVLVTGAGSGIGRAVALAFAAEGAAVVVAGRTAAPLDETVELIEKEGGKAVAVTADVTRSEDVRALVRSTVEHFGSLDVAVNNAGVFRGGGPVADLAEEDWRSMLDINVTGVLLSLQAEVAAMREQPGGGAIVNISSNLGAHTRIPGAAGYLTTKAAVSALTRAAALDHIADGVRINAVSPGATATTMSLRPGEGDAERAERMKDESPVGRVSSTAEVAAAVLYLASPDAGSVVGTDLVIDGGVAA